MQSNQQNIIHPSNLHIMAMQSTKRKATTQGQNLFDDDNKNLENIVEILSKTVETLTLQLNNSKTQIDDLNKKFDDISKCTNTTNSKKKTGPKALGGSAYNHFIKSQMEINKNNGYFESNNIKGREKMKYCAALWRAHKQELLNN